MPQAFLPAGTSVLTNDIAPTTIGSGAYIGPNSMIAKGVTIGDRAVIGAMSFVNADIPAGKKAWGTPAKVVGDSV